MARQSKEVGWEVGEYAWCNSGWHGTTTDTNAVLQASGHLSRTFASDSPLKRFLSDWTLALVAAAVIVVVLGWLSRETSTPEVAPDFTIETTDGESFTLSSYRGKIVVVNFWATWCGPCLKEIPHFTEFAENNSDVQIIGIAVQSSAPDVAGLDQRYDITYPLSVTRKGDSVLDDYAMNQSNTVFPTTFVVNAEGKIVGGRIESSLSYNGLESLVAQARETN
jgi:thiol-disulfide isomerase/thioredoxin